MVILPITNDEKISSINPNEVEGAINNEAETKHETSPSPPPSPNRQPSLQDNQTEAISTLQNTEEIQQIKDETGTSTKTHPLEQTGDNLTAEADKEEEELIEGVEKRHGHL